MSFPVIQQTLQRLFADTLVPGLVLTESVSFVKKAPADAASFNFTTGKPGETPAAPVAIRAPVHPYDQKQIAKSDGWLKTGDARIYLDAEQVASVAIGDEVIWRGLTYTVFDVRENRLNETTLVWECSLRN